MQLIRMFLVSFAGFVVAGWGSPAVADVVIRILAGNLSSGNGQDYDLGHGNRILQGLKPDIALVQEMNYQNNTPTNFRSWVDTNFGTTFSYARGTSGSIPNGIVSRYPIVASGQWDDAELTDREFTWARIDLPGDKDLWAISVHLKASSGSENVGRRNNQANRLLSYIAANIPNADYLVIGGDFNTYSRNESCLNTLSEVFVTGSPWPVDQGGDGDTNSGRSSPYDWVIPDTDLNARKTPLVIGTLSFPNGLVFDSRDFTPLSAVSPILAADSGATGMQHMAVVRAFSIPTNNPPLIAGAATSTSSETIVDPDSSVRQIVRGNSIVLSVLASDDGGEAALKYTWRITSGAAVSFSANATNSAKKATATFPATGDYTIAVAATDAAGLSVSSALKLRVVQTAGGLAMSPTSTSVVVNETQAFSATLLDQYNLPMATQPATFTWSASGGGAISPGGMFTATTAGGPFTVTASNEGFSAKASVTVTRAAATIDFANLLQTYDGSPKPVTASTVPADLAVSILYDGSATPPSNAGTYSVAAWVIDPNYQGSANDTLVISPDPWTQWKSLHFTPQEQADGLSDNHADPDADGCSNLVEYALGSDPRTFTPPLAYQLDGNGLSLTFTRPAGLPGILYTAESSVGLDTWTRVPLEVTVLGETETLRAVQPQDGPARFLRLRIESE